MERRRRAHPGIGLLLFLGALPLSAEPVRPLVFIPGILGSRLVSPDGELVWGGASSYLNFSELALPRDESAIGLRPDGVIRSIPIVWPFEVKQYAGLFETLEGIGYEEGRDLFVFAYDWRRSNFKTAALLEAFVQATPQLAGRPFDIVAHSMGGLVALAFLHEQDSGSSVANLVTLGTPFFGSLNALETSLNGFSGVGAFMSEIGASEDEIRSVMLSFESGYELLPSYENCCILGARSDPQRRPVDVFGVSFWQGAWLPPSFTSAEDKAFVANALSEGRRLSALAHEGVPDTARLFMFAGDKFATQAQVYLDAGGHVDEYGELGGDGTVWLTSAARNHVADSRVSFEKHARIFDDASLRVELQRILAPSGELEDFSASAEDVTLVSAAGERVRVDLVSFEVVPPLAPLGERVELVLGLRGAEIQGSQETFDLEICLEGPASLCVDLQEDTGVETERRYRARVRPGAAGSYSAHLSQHRALEDYFAVVRAD